MRDPRVWLALAWATAVIWSDVRGRRISNVLSLGAAAFGLAALAVDGHAWLGASAASAFAGAGIALAFTVPAWACRRLGGGDVKFLFAVGLVGGVTVVLQAFVIGALLAGLMAFGWLLAARYGTPRAEDPGAASSVRRLPFGAAMALGLAGAAIGAPA